MKNKFKSILLILLVLTISAGCASVNTKAGEAAIAYTGGPIEGTKFDKVVKPGSGLVWLGVSDDYYLYPVTQRDYIISRVQNEGDRSIPDFITAPNKDGIPIEWELAVYFKLNISKIRKFHENVGLRYNAYFPKGTDDVSEDNLKGWNNMLNNVFRQQIEGTIQRVSREHSTDDFARNSDIFAKLNGEIAAGLKDQINLTVGDNYFCGPGFKGDVAEDNKEVECPELEVQVKAVTLPQSTRDQYTANKNSEIEVTTRRNQGDANVVAKQKEAEANVAEAEGKKKANEALADIYKDPTFIEYLNALAAQACASNKDNCTMIIMNDGAGVNVSVQP